MKKRNPNVELWRCVCMGAVVLGHIVYNNSVTSMDGYCWHIPGFLLITGFFGTRFSLRKIASLVGIVYGCYWLTIPYRGVDSLISLVLPHGGWFLPFYCVLMALSPILNSSLKDKANILPILCSVVFLLFVGWVPTLFDDVHISMVRIPGLQREGMLLMMATYFIGAALREYKIDRRGNPVVWGLAFLCGVASLTVWGKWLLSNSYASPAAIVTAVCGFMFTISLPQISGRVAKIINFIAPSMFSVYILHETCIRKVQYMPGNHTVINAVLWSFMIFVLCIFIDLMRRFIMYGLRKMIMRCVCLSFSRKAK